MATDTKVTLLKLFDALRELREKEDAIVSEIATLLGGGEGIGPKVTRLKALWQATWFERYHSDYTFTNHPRVGADLKRFLKSHTEGEIGARMFTYIKTDDPFFVRSRHSFEIYVRAFNQCVGLPSNRIDEAAQQSADKAREMRGV